MTRRSRKICWRVSPKISGNAYDWLGDPAYFWEGDSERGLQWASEMQCRGAPIAKPFVVGTVIDPGWFLELTTQASLDVIRKVFEEPKSVAATRRGVRFNAISWMAQRSRFLILETVGALGDKEIRPILLKPNERPFR